MTTSSSLTRRGFLQHSVKIAAAGMGTGAILSTPAQAAAEKTKADRWRIGCFTRPWDKHDYRVALDAIAEAGFKHAGLMTTKSKTRLVISATTSIDQAAKIDKEVKKRGLSVPSVYGGGIPVHQTTKEAVEALRKLIDSCAVVGAKTLMMGGVSGENRYEIYYKAIAECCDYAAEKKLVLVLKPHGGLNATGPQCRKAIEKVGHKSFQLWYDPGNIFYYSNGALDPVVDAATVDGLVTGMCIKDYQHPKQVLITPGTGKVNFPAVMARLEKGGLTGGPLVIETLKPGGLPELLVEAKKGRKFVEDLTRKPDAAPSAKK